MESIYNILLVMSSLQETSSTSQNASRSATGFSLEDFPTLDMESQKAVPQPKAPVSIPTPAAKPDTAKKSVPKQTQSVECPFGCQQNVELSQQGIRRHFATHHRKVFVEKWMVDSTKDIFINWNGKRYVLEFKPSRRPYEFLCDHGSSCHGLSGGCPYNHPDTDLCRHGEQCSMRKCRFNHPSGHAMRVEKIAIRLANFPKVHPVYHTMCQLVECPGKFNGECHLNHQGQPICKFDAISDKNPLVGCTRPTCYYNHKFGHALRCEYAKFDASANTPS
jgi:hypothetical protein